MYNNLVVAVSLLICCLLTGCVGSTVVREGKQGLSFQELNITCLNIATLSDTLVIKDQESYNKLRKKIMFFLDDCSSPEFPEIDFEKYILLGLKTNTLGCTRPKYEKKVYVLKDSLVVCEINPTSEGDCKKQWSNFHWIKINQTNHQIECIIN